MKKFFQEFKTFITRGNVLDMSVGVIVGGAFTAIVNGLTNFILKPLVNWIIALILGDTGLESAVTILSPAYVKDANGVFVLDPETNKKIVDLANSIYIDWGAFVSAIINFLLIAFVLFTIVRAINKANESVAHAKKLGGALTKKEVRDLRKQGKTMAQIKAIQQQRLDDLAEQQRIADEEAAKNAPKTEQQLLAEIVELLKEKQQ